MSGHSKWAQIKHKKAATDQKKGVLYSKLAREITVAARLAGPDPASNQRLRAALERARSCGLPKENSERAIERASGTADAGTLQEFLYEALGPDGALLLIQGITDNANRTLADIRQILARHNAKLADPGSILWNFERIAMFRVPRPPSTRESSEIELLLIDAGARDFSEGATGWIVEAGPADIEGVHARLREKKILPTEAEMGYKAKIPISLSPKSAQALHALTEELDEHPDIQSVRTNIASDSASP